MSDKRLKKFILVMHMACQRKEACQKILDTYDHDIDTDKFTAAFTYSHEEAKDARDNMDLCNEIIEDMKKAIETLEEDPRQNAALDRKSSENPTYVVLLRQPYNSGSASLIKEYNTGYYLVQTYGPSGGLEWTHTFSCLTDARDYYFSLFDSGNNA